jgi:hypothetical protein
MTGTSVSWDAPSAIGVSPAEAFSALAGSCTATIVWDGSPSNGAAVIEPLRGQSTITVNVQLDPSSAVLVSSPVSDCSSYLQAAASVRLETEDGNFLEEREVVVRYDAQSGAAPIRFEVRSSETSGSLSIEPVDGGGEVRLDYEVSPLTEGCAGRVLLSVSQTDATGAGGGSAASTGAFASWSDTGCEAGQAPVPIDEPVDGGLSIAGSVEALWGDVAYRGVWDDGQPADLRMRLTIATGIGCADSVQPNTVAFASAITYGTSDDRVREHPATADIRVTTNGSGAPEYLQLWVDDELSCADPSDSIPYTLRSCDELASASLQLGINVDVQTSLVDSQGLNAYEYYRAGMASPGAADTVRTWTLEAAR